ncbi:hypothetical protein B0H17DRAFT_580162 [Mycena rosella]|uniref:Uncharacterized protein n=1 Tax=Mycena rosella TaxID=1033263 RepID=A0AAD7BL62_MYCRO|nr:hypothetical protein B0H17DRAFT_580162 [Mycena rosella]
MFIHARHPTQHIHQLKYSIDYFLEHHEYPFEHSLHLHLDCALRPEHPGAKCCSPHYDYPDYRRPPRPVRLGRARAGFRRRVVLPTLARFGAGTIQTTVVPDDPFISDIPEAKAKALPSYFRRRVVPVNKSFLRASRRSIILTKSVPDDPFFTEIPEAQARGAYFRRRVVLPEAASEQSPSTRMALRRKRSARASVLSGLLSVYNWRSAPAAAV